MNAQGHVKTAEEVRAEFDRRGQTVTDWAAAHGYSRSLVFEVLRGRIKGRRGKAHEVAVLLGLKKGVIVKGTKRRAA